LPSGRRRPAQLVALASPSAAAAISAAAAAAKARAAATPVRFRAAATLVLAAATTVVRSEAVVPCGCACESLPAAGVASGRPPGMVVR